MGSFVSRPEDLQTLSLPLSLVAMAGYLVAVARLRGGGRGRCSPSFVPPFSPFVMLARLMVGRSQPWEVALSIGLLVVIDRGRGLVATRMYAAGVLLYGQRPGLRTFIAAARRAGWGYALRLVAILPRGGRARRTVLLPLAREAESARVRRFDLLDERAASRASPEGSALAPAC